MDAESRISSINFIEGLPDMTSLDPTKANLLIMDDLMHDMNEVVAKLFTKGSHHRNTSVLLLTSNIFHKNKHSRTVSLKVNYMVLFKNVQDASQITNLAKQMYLGNVKYLKSSYEDATNKHYGYFLIDLKPDTSDLLRLRTDIFPGKIHYVYHEI